VGGEDGVTEKRPRDGPIKKGDGGDEKKIRVSNRGQEGTVRCRWGKGNRPFTFMRRNVGKVGGLDYDSGKRKELFCSRDLGGEFI